MERLSSSAIFPNRMFGGSTGIFAVSPLNFRNCLNTLVGPWPCGAQLVGQPAKGGLTHGRGAGGLEGEALKAFRVLIKRNPFSLLSSLSLSCSLSLLVVGRWWSWRGLIPGLARSGSRHVEARSFLGVRAEAGNRGFRGVSVDFGLISK